MGRERSPDLDRQLADFRSFVSTASGLKGFRVDWPQELGFLVLLVDC